MPLPASAAPDTANGPHDLVSELLLGMRLRGVVYRRVRLQRPFGLAYGAAPGRAQFHFIAQGPVLLRQPDGSLQRFDSGDAIFLPKGGAHALVSAPDIAAEDIGAFAADLICSDVAAIGDCADCDCPPDDLVLFSGCMEFDLGSMHPLVAMMPDVLQVGLLAEAQPEMLPILEAMEREMRAERAGFAGILARLADVVAASIVRGWVECGCANATGWVEALRDPQLGRVLLAIHQDPGRNWSLQELAGVMGVSRSVFAERFQTIAGMTPLRYLTELRMRLAQDWIGTEGRPIGAVAHSLGYGSQAAFSRAFKRTTGRSPGSLRAG